MDFTKNVDETSKAILNLIIDIDEASSLDELNSANRNLRLALQAMSVHLATVVKEAQHLTDQRRAYLNDQLYKDL